MFGMKTATSRKVESRNNRQGTAMANTDTQWKRLATITALITKQRSGSLGRTALMKYCYFLKELRGVPLNYHFTLYSYGPFDSTVLADLQYAESLNAVESELEVYSSGYGYKLKSGPKAQQLTDRARDFISRYEEDIDAVVETFSGKSASELEMLSTVLYVDREWASIRQPVKMKQVVDEVSEVKPHLDRTQISKGARWLKEKGFLKATQA
jgi:hypothetical protein